MDWLRSNIALVVGIVAGIVALAATVGYVTFGTLNKSKRVEQRMADRSFAAESEAPSESSSRTTRTESTLDEVPQGSAKRDPVVGDSADEAQQGESDAPDKPDAGQLTAGRWDDLERWDYWTDLFGQNADGENPHQWGKWEDGWQFFTRRRIGVSVTSGDGPAVDAEVTLEDSDGNQVWRARTDNRGRAEVFAGLFGDSAEGPYTIIASSDGAQSTTTVDGLPDDGRLSLDLAGAEAPLRTLDLMFVVDTTGSMGDELSYVQSELGDVVERSQKYFGGELDIRTSVNVYRDTGDDYVVKTNPFRDSAGQAVRDIESEEASGGGNYPEAVDRALAQTIDDHDWRDRATARLMFLVLDAPPHDDPEIKARLHDAVEAAAAEGVRIIPVAGSGVDKKTEFVLRSLAIATGGLYTFLTDDSGIGGSHIEPTIGDHEVHYLNDLLVTIVHDYTKTAGDD